MAEPTVLSREPGYAIADRTAENMAARTEKTLVVPLVAMGSVPQYAVQLVIDGQRGQLVKQAVDSLYVYPFAGREMSIAEVAAGTAGSRAETADQMVSPWELYHPREAGDGDVEYMQMHSPVIPGCESLYVKQLVAIVKERGYRRVVLLDAVDKGLWHGETAAGASSQPSETDLAGVSVLRWGNRTLGGMKLAAEGDGETPGEDGPSVEEWPGPLVRLVGEAIDAAAAAEDVAVEAFAVPVYDGWNGPAARALLAAAGVDQTGPTGEKAGRGAVGSSDGLERFVAADENSLARLEGVYN